MNRIFCSLFFLLAACTPQPSNFDGQHVGNGGDVLVKLFERGRTHALKVLEAVEAVEDSRVRSWFTENRTALIADVKATPDYGWVKLNDNGACGKTAHARRSPISLSYDSCRGITTLREAAIHLIGESVHHFEIRDDTFTGAVAVAVAKAWDKRVGATPDAIERRMLFDGARIQAAEVFLRIRSENIPSAFRDLYSAEERGWLFEHRSQVADDIAKSDHLWVEGGDANEPCFATKAAPADPIELSYSACAIARREAAGQTLAEASITHLGGARRLAALAYAIWFNMGHPDIAHWQTIPPHSSSVRDVYRSIWTGKELLAWSAGLQNIYFYDPRTNQWRTQSATTKVDSYRTGESAHWISGRVVVFGDCYKSPDKIGAGRMFDPKASVWLPMTRVGAPSERWFGSATTLALDDKLVLFGGWNSCASGEERAPNDFATYDPARDVWHTKPVDVGTPLARRGAIAVDLGEHRLMVWGGLDGDSARADGAIYDYDGVKLRDVSKERAPKARGLAKSVAGGGFVTMLGGYTMFDRLSNPYRRSLVADGAIYDIARDKWIPMSLKNAPRFDPDKPFELIWIGNEVLYVGNSIAYFNPLRNEWRSTNRALTPLLKNPYHSEPGVFWTGVEAIVWDAWSYGETLSGYAYYP